MEFEPNKPPTDQEITLADIPHVTVAPLNPIVSIPSFGPGAADPAAKRTFEFESESTKVAATAVKDESLSTHALALWLSVGTALLFGGILLAMHLLS